MSEQVERKVTCGVCGATGVIPPNTRKGHTERLWDLKTSTLPTIQEQLAECEKETGETLERFMSQDDWNADEPPKLSDLATALEAKLAKAERDLDEERNRYADMTVEELLIEAIQSTDYSEVKYLFEHSEKIAALAEESE